MMLPNYVTPPRHVLDGAAQGSELLARECWHGMVSFTRRPYECMSREGLMGLPKGVVLGSYELTRGVADGTLDLVSNVVEGIRNTPDTVANAMIGQDRPHWKYGIDDEEGRILETHLQRPSKQVVDGTLKGVGAVSTAVTGGVVDLIAKPMDCMVNDEHSWAVGIAKGVGQGLVGFTAKTAAGALDFTDAVTDGLRHTPGWVADEIAELRGFGRDAPVKREFVGGGGGGAHPGPAVSHRYWDCLQNPGTGREGALHPGVHHLQAQATAGGGWGAQTTQQAQFWSMVQEQQEADASGSVTYRGPLQAGLAPSPPLAQAAGLARVEQGAPLLSVLPPGATVVSRAPTVRSAPTPVKVPSYAPSAAVGQPAMCGAQAVMHHEPWVQAPIGFYRPPVGGEGGLAQRWRGQA